MTNSSYGLYKQIDLSYDEAVPHVTEALKAEGFGILTEIDVKATMKTKLDVDMGKYIILGACNPGLAHQALQSEQTVGLLLPCNVIVYEDEASGKAGVGILDPSMLVQVSANEGLKPIAKEARERLERVIDSL